MVLTKVWVTHPHKADPQIGLIMFKRIVTHVCTGNMPDSCKEGDIVADVHKVGMCLKCRRKFAPVKRRRNSPSAAYNSHYSSGSLEENKRFLTCLKEGLNATDGSIMPDYACPRQARRRTAPYSPATASIAGF